MNENLTQQTAKEQLAGASVIPAAAEALSELAVAREIGAAAQAKVEQVLSLDRQWQSLLADIKELKGQVEAIEKTVGPFRERTEILKKRISLKIGDSNINSYAEDLYQMILRERVLKLFPQVLEKRKAELAEALADAVAFAAEHKVSPSLLPEGAQAGSAQ